MNGERESSEKAGRVNSYFGDQISDPVEPSTAISNRGKRPFMAAMVVASDNDEPANIPSGSAALPHKSESVINNETSNSDAHSITADGTIASSTKDTIVVLITLTIILFTLVATYFLWRKRRRSVASSHCNRLEEYRYSRLSQNDAEVDNISFQGDLTHKSLINSVPVCAEEDGEDERTKPATLCLEYDSLVTISNEDKAESQRKSMNSQSSRPDVVAPANMLLDELSDEDLLQ